MKMWMWGAIPREKGAGLGGGAPTPASRALGGLAALLPTAAAWLSRAPGPFNLSFHHLWNRSRPNHSFPLWLKWLPVFLCVKHPLLLWKFGSGMSPPSCISLCSASRAGLGEPWSNWGISFLSRAGGIDQRIHREPWKRTEQFVHQRQTAFKGILTNGASGESWYYEDQ